ncbi:glycogenin-1-like isoform X2 [Episyrphus balteatus]|uniref:glycogenin-1-like isoform X2 n=1 Tax=Episyrphus balteatus TaxID=286459 RepID=UPI0024865B4D|nr:glycogenin-1-like isoform X2 [Episyrphus balteatus]
MSKCAWVTLTTNDAYSLGAMVLAHSLKRVGTVHDLVVMITPTVSEAMRSRLRDVFDLVQEVNVLDSKDAANLAILARPELGITFTKLHCWKLVQYQKCVFLDSDTLVIQNSDELMEREELSAAPEVCWPDCFNSGVFVYRPNEATFNSIIEFAAKNGSFDGGDQGILNSYFSQWAHTDISKHLPYTYNTAAFAVYSYLPAFKEFKNKIKILHFAGKMKPWLLNFNSETKVAQIPPMFTHAGDFIQLWWNIFCDNVHQKLSDQMLHEMRTYWPIQESQIVPPWAQENIPNLSSSPSVSNYDSGNFFDDIQPYHDPWEDYYENLEKLKEQNFTNHINEIFIEPKSPSSSQPQQHQNQPDNQVSYSHHDETHHTQAASPPQVIEQSSCDQYNQIQQNWSQNIDKQQEQVETYWHDADPQSSRFQTINTDGSDTHRTLTESELNQSLNEALLDEEENQYNLDSSAITVSSDSSDDYEDSLDVSPQNDSNKMPIANEAGLAGALAQVRLGEPRSTEQEAYEASMRRQCWEVGNIDYTGRDSFDNIWKKITETLETKPDGKSADGSN